VKTGWQFDESLGATRRGGNLCAAAENPGFWNYFGNHLENMIFSYKLGR